MNAKLTSIGFYITCIIFFGFQSKSVIHTNNTQPPATIVGSKAQLVEGEKNSGKFEAAATGNQKIKPAGQFGSKSQIRR